MPLQLSQVGFIANAAALPNLQLPRPQHATRERAAESAGARVVQRCSLVVQVKCVAVTPAVITHKLTVPLKSGQTILLCAWIPLPRDPLPITLDHDQT